MSSPRRLVATAAGGRGAEYRMALLHATGAKAPCPITESPFRSPWSSQRRGGVKWPSARAIRSAAGFGLTTLLQIGVRSRALRSGDGVELRLTDACGRGMRACVETARESADVRGRAATRSGRSSGHAPRRALPVSRRRAPSESSVRFLVGRRPRDAIASETELGLPAWPAHGLAGRGRNSPEFGVAVFRSSRKEIPVRPLNGNLPTRHRFCTTRSGEAGWFSGKGGPMA
jgi:hypothetical protein